MRPLAGGGGLACNIRVMAGVGWGTWLAPAHEGFNRPEAVCRQITEVLWSVGSFLATIFRAH